MMVKSWPKLNRRVETDDFEMLDGEQVYHPHEGEWVEFRRKIAPADIKVMADFSTSDAPGLRETVQNFDLICKLLARVVIDWNWTGPDGEAYAKPHNDPKAFEELSDDELGYLMRKFQEPLTVPKNTSGESSAS